MYDFIIVGTGSAGAHTAYFLAKYGAKVAVVEQYEIGAGGSGAAGAFISPRIGKGGPIQRWTNEAFRYCVEFYKNSPHFYPTGLLRLPKDGEDFSQVVMDVEYERKDGGFFFPQAGVLKAKPHLEALLKNIDVIYTKAYPKFGKGVVEVAGRKAKHLILATGAWDELLDVAYLRIGKTSGVRFDLRSDLALPYSIHKKVSISANLDGIVSIGATHQRLDTPSRPQPLSMLFEEAKKMVGEFRYRIEQMYCGVRSSVNDHLPIVGELASALPKVKNFKHFDFAQIPKRNVSIVGGLGGRGFVFGPFVGDMLARHLIDNEPIPKELDVDRYVVRYLKKGRV